jgi:glutamine amidotransferase
MKKISVGIVNYKCNNLFSIYQACRAVGFKTKIIEKKDDKYLYDIIILPGIGSYGQATNYLSKNGIKDKLFNFLEKNNKIIFGICLGMQLLFEKSNEFGSHKGLGFIKGSVEKINIKQSKKIPNTGWLNLKTNNNANNFLKNINNKQMFYFTHSFVCKPTNSKIITSYSKINNYEFCSSIKQKNILGTQFHPEKSHVNGLNILKLLKKQI